MQLKRLNPILALSDYYTIRQWESRHFRRTLQPRYLRMQKHFHKVPVGYAALAVLAVVFWGNDFFAFIELGGYQGYRQQVLEQQEEYHMLQVDNVKSFNKWQAYEEKTRKFQENIASQANAQIVTKYVNKKTPVEG